MMGTRFFVFLGATISVWWAILAGTGYRKSDYDLPVGGPPWTEAILWHVYLRGPSEQDTRDFQLPESFRSQSRRGDRVQHIDHSMEFLGFKVFASEAILWRDERKLDVWRQYVLPASLLASLWAMSPLIIAGIAAGSINYVRPKNGPMEAEQPPESRKPLLKQKSIHVLIGTTSLSILLLIWRMEFHEENDALLVSRAAEGFKGAAIFEGHPDGAWTGDVAELYRIGAIRRAIAEADAAPIRPLVAHPRPYHGYLFVAMDTGPERVPLKSAVRNRGSFAFCAYPAKEGPNQRVWLVCSTGFFGRLMDGGKPVLNWPSDLEMQQHWGRFCSLPAPPVSSVFCCATR